MFKKVERLSRSEFSEYFKVGRKHHCPHLTIITAPLTSRKVSVVVGKKVAKSAVKRNVLKRRVYAMLRTILTEAKYSGVLIVIVKPSLNSLSKKALKDSVAESVAQVVKGA